jgi:hypothetical protein
LRPGSGNVVGGRRARSKATGAHGPPSSFEAGHDGFWLARWLAAQGVEAHVISCIEGCDALARISAMSAHLERSEW